MPSSVNKNSSWRQRSEMRTLADLTPEMEKEMDRLDREFWVSGEKLKEIVGRFREELEEGLEKNGTNVPMNVSWVHAFPSGNEKGTYLALDLGGTNLRVCKVTLHGNETDLASPGSKYSLDQEQFKISEDLKTGNADQLWIYVAEKLQTFLQDRGLDKEYSKDRPMPLGFTFSYPASQDKIDHAVLQTWTKGFDIKGVEGKDAAAQLREKMEERKLPVELVCVINDTVGAMIASAYNDPETIIGAIFGTGCNAAYMSSLASIKKLDPNDSRLERKATAAEGETPDSVKDERRMAINCEYGAFDNAHRVLPMTKYDKQIDAESPRPGEQAFEKLSAGLYLGEIFRLVLVDLADRNLVFVDQDTRKLRKSYTIDTGFLSQVEEDETPNCTKTSDLFSSTLDIRITEPEIEFARRLAELVAVRGARLCACGIAAICLEEGIQSGHVAADGSVANKHPKFKRRWAEALGEVLDWKNDASGKRDDPITITSAEDGSGVGCAIIAAMEMERREA